MKVNNIECLIEEIKKIGDLLKKNKKNYEWSEVVDIKKNTTRGDYKLDNLLKTALLKFGMDVPYYSEEVVHKITDRPKNYWLADPIDGTSSWLGGFEGYVIQAAYIENKKPLFSFIYWPERQKFFHCYKGKGIFLNGEKIIVDINHSQAITLVDNYPEPKGFVKGLIASYSDIKYKEMGSLGLKSLLVGTGFCDLFIKTTKFRDWDVIPAKLFLDEIKFKMLYLNGKNFIFGDQIEFDQGLLVYNPYKVDNGMINHIKEMEIKFEV
jgi:3'(2'), 5'-bisphosphate nucleotidase